MGRVVTTSQWRQHLEFRPSRDYAPQRSFLQNLSSCAERLLLKGGDEVCSLADRLSWRAYARVSTQSSAKAFLEFQLCTPVALAYKRPWCIGSHHRHGFAPNTCRRRPTRERRGSLTCPVLVIPPKGLPYQGPLSEDNAVLLMQQTAAVFREENIQKETTRNMQWLTVDHFSHQAPQISGMALSLLAIPTLVRPHRWPACVGGQEWFCCNWYNSKLLLPPPPVAQNPSWGLWQLQRYTTCTCKEMNHPTFRPCHWQGEGGRSAWQDFLDLLRALRRKLWAPVRDLAPSLRRGSGGPCTTYLFRVT